MLFLSLPRPGTRLDLSLPPSVSFPVSRESTRAFLKCAGSQAGVEAVADPSTDRRVKETLSKTRRLTEMAVLLSYLWSHCS